MNKAERIYGAATVDLLLKIAAYLPEGLKSLIQKVGEKSEAHICIHVLA